MATDIIGAMVELPLIIIFKLFWLWILILIVILVAYFGKKIFKGNRKLRICPKCGMQNDASTRFCTDCGFGFKVN